MNLLRDHRYRAGRVLAGMAGALVLVAGLAGPAAAYQIVSEVGAHGSVYLDDTTTTPAGTCKYGKFLYSNWSYIQWMQVRAPHVFAADRNSAKRDHRVVTWQWQLQRHAFVYPAPATGWKTVATSKRQRATAYEDAQAPFTAMRVYFDGKSHAPAPPTYASALLRALVVIKWFKPDGSLEATVKLIPDYYRLKTVFAPDHTGGQPWCGLIATSG